ncbi:MAG: TIGR02186 family protein [Pseudomonadota bacterium]
MVNILCKPWKELALLCIVLIPSLALADGPMTISATPNTILMGARYDGISLKVAGSVPAGSDVVLRFTGAPEDLHLREKGKVFGLLWMNVGKVALKNVPKVCLIDSSRSFADLGAIAEPFRLESLGSSVEVEKDAAGGEIDVIHELLLLKKNDHLYHESAGGVVLGPDKGDSRTFTADIAVPSALAPGHYSVEAVAVRGGALVGKASSAVEASLSGFPGWLAKMAFERSLLYGVLATVIAIVSGLAIGLIFQSKGAH